MGLCVQGVPDNGHRSIGCTRFRPLLLNVDQIIFSFKFVSLFFFLRVRASVCSFFDTPSLIIFPPLLFCSSGTDSKQSKYIIVCLLLNWKCCLLLYNCRSCRSCSREIYMYIIIINNKKYRAWDIWHSISCFVGVHR